jgi:glutamine phosphoribosylpyrophosphate amidotransferase
MNKKLSTNIDTILVKNINYIPQKEREIIVKKIIESFNDSIEWISIIKTFKCIIENNKNSSLCQSVFCVNYIKKLLKNQNEEQRIYKSD